MSRTAIPAEALEHGDSRRYHRGCRCRPCIKAATAQAAKWRYLRNTGRGALISPAPAVARVWALRAAGMVDAEIATAAGLGSPHLRQIMRSEGKIRYDTAAKILAVQFPDSPATLPRSYAPVPSLGTMRRLRALTADGWPARTIEQHVGAGSCYVPRLLRQDPGITVRLATSIAVRRACDALTGQIPEQHGVSVRSAEYARKRALKNDWLGTAYWDPDDYDNPAFVPAGSDTAALKKVDVTHLLRCGIPSDEVKARTGASIAYVREVAAELRTGKPRIRSRQTAAAA